MKSTLVGVTETERDAFWASQLNTVLEVVCLNYQANKLAIAINA